MTTQPLRYSLTLFCSNVDIAPSGAVITKLLSGYAKYDLIPSTFYELSTPMPSPRIRLAKVSNEWGIDIPSSRVDVEQLPLDRDGANMRDLGRFSATGLDMLDTFLRLYPRRAWRLGTATREFLPEMSHEKLEAAFSKISTTVSYYAKNPPFEWVHRAVAKDVWEHDDGVEKINVITTLTRAQGVMGAPQDTKPFDRLCVEFDINTEAENKDTRFGSRELGLFIPRAFQLRDQILAELLLLFK